MQNSVPRGVLSEDSKDWLTACLDPFHDYQYEAEGLPDERVAPSVVQIHNQVLTLTAPLSAIEADSNWDASILYTGFNSPINGEAIFGGMTTVTGSSVHTYDSSALKTGTSFGALNIWAGESNGDGMSTGAPVNGADTYLSLGSILGNDRCRLIGVAFEVNNTTASIYKQGSLTTAILPDASSDTSQVLYGDKATVSPKTTATIQADRAVKQASTLNPLMSVPGSCTWPAKEGAYVIPRMAYVPRDTFSYGFKLGGGGDAGASTRVPILYGTDGKTATLEPTGFHSVQGISSPLFKPCCPSGFTPVQSWFSGLSPQTTLTITFRTIVEYFPALDSSLLPLARPSPVFDPKALALYSAVAARAPYAVPVEQNAAGDYFRKILAVVAQGARIIAPIFGPWSPVVSAAGNLASRIGKAIPKREAGPVAQGRRDTSQAKPILRRQRDLRN